MVYAQKIPNEEKLRIVKAKKQRYEALYDKHSAKLKKDEAAFEKKSSSLGRKIRMYEDLVVNADNRIERLNQRIAKQNASTPAVAVN